MAISINREKKILEFLQKQGSASIQQLVEAFDVSNMTIHRDLKKMEAAGLLKKVHGGVRLAQASAAVNSCAMCGKSALDRSAFLMTLASGEQVRACCPHCGLMIQSQKKKAQGLATDFLRGQMVSANQATYLIGSEISVCCMPSVLSFGSKQDAEKFKKGFGGIIATMQEAVEYLHDTMRA